MKELRLAVSARKTVTWTWQKSNEMKKKKRTLRLVEFGRASLPFEVGRKLSGAGARVSKRPRRDVWARLFPVNGSGVRTR
jgi:hypothetical protein